MKFSLHRLRIGDLVWAQIVEKLDNHEMIVSFQGDLIRVRNQSMNTFALGDKALVKVMGIEPLTFQLVESEKNRGATRMNISV